MRFENLPDEGHDKIILSRERSRDGTRDKASRQCNSETSWRRTTATLLGICHLGVTEDVVETY